MEVQKQNTPFSRRSLLGHGLSIFALESTSLSSWAANNETAAIRFGQSLPISGPLAKLGNSHRESVVAVFSEHNENGGVGGRRLELISLDDENRPEKTEVNVKLLAAEHRVAALFGFLGAGAHSSGARAAAIERLPYIAPVSGSKELRNGTHPSVFNMRASHDDEIDTIVRHIKQIGLKRAALVIEYNSAGWEVRDALIETQEKYGLDSASISSVDHQGSDFSLLGAVNTALAGQPQAIILGADYGASARFVTAVLKAGYKGPFYTLSTVGGSALINELGDQAFGLSVTQVVPFPWTSSSKVSRDYQAFCTKRKLEPSFVGMEAYLSANLLVNCCKRLREGVSSSSLFSVLASNTAVDFGGYVGSFYSRERSKLDQVDLVVYSKSGKFLR